MKCIACGFDNEEGVAYCVSCGSGLAPADGVEIADMAAEDCQVGDDSVQAEDEHFERDVMAEGLPDWDLLPPDLMIFRKRSL